MEQRKSASRHTWRSGWRRVALAVLVAAAMGLGVYALLESIRPVSGLVSFSFLLILPAAICALVSYIADPWGELPLRRYLMVPVWILLAATALSIVVLREGTVCVLMVSPLWLLSGVCGAALTWRLRDKAVDGTVYCAALLVLPLLAIQIEPLFPVPAATATVVRSAIIAAPPERIWPLLRGIPDVRPEEGRWNFSQDVVGIPRPISARLLGEGVGAVRLANWGEQVRFDERITEWRPGERIGWSFHFDDIAGWKFTDRHLMPNSSYFRVTTGGYTLRRLPDGRSKLTIATHYWMRTPVNGYASLWGEVFLGDLENNLLALVRGRAEEQAKRAN
ncbi:MAG: SRPBCC family protein [Sphingomonadales bacterium]|nr:SRPBCC family protein [Sphingomonadales bacterium]